MSIDEAIATAVRTAVREEVPRAVEQALAKLQPVQHGDYLTPAEAAKVAGVHVDTIRLWLKAGKLPMHHAGQRKRVRREDLDHFLSEGPANDNGPSADEIAAAALAKRKGKAP